MKSDLYFDILLLMTNQSPVLMLVGVWNAWRKIGKKHSHLPHENGYSIERRLCKYKMHVLQVWNRICITHAFDHFHYWTCEPCECYNYTELKWIWIHWIIYKFLEYKLSLNTYCMILYALLYVQTFRGQIFSMEFSLLSLMYHLKQNL